MTANVASSDPGAPFDAGMGVMIPDPSVIATGRIANEVYTSEEQHELEMENIFRKTWLYVARTNEIPSPGSFVVREYLGLSMLIVRGKDDKVRVFHNVCTHRASPLVWEERGKRANFVCPYHAWCFAPDGRLAQVPDQDCFPGLEVSELGLKPINSDVYGIFIFINLQDRPSQSLTDFLGEWGVRHQGLPWEDYEVVGRMSGINTFNWKQGLENGTETYHAFQLHKHTLGHFIPKDNPFLHQPKVAFYGPHGHYTMPLNHDYATPEGNLLQKFISPRVMQIVSQADYSERAASSGRATFANHPGVNLDKSASFGSSNYIVFPNIAMVISVGGWHNMRYWPLGPNKTYWESEFSYFKPKTWSERFAQMAQMTANRDATFEDLAISAAQQRGLQSKAVEYSRFNNWGEMLPRHQAACVVAMTGGANAGAKAAAE